MPGLSILRVVGNDELKRIEDEQIANDVASRQQEPVILNMAAHLRSCWDAAYMARNPITLIMLKALRQRNGEYEADKIAAIKGQGGSEVYMMLTEVKCRAAESWLRDILLEEGTPPWDVQPTPIPDMPPEKVAEIQDAFAEKIVELISLTGQAPNKEQMLELKELAAQEYRFKLLQEAQTRANQMKTRIEDQFAQGGWAHAFNEFISDLTTFPCAFLKGPIVRRQRYLQWTTGPDGKMKADTGERLAPEYERVSPFNIYPEPGVTDINDGYLFEHHKMSRPMLADLIGVPGYDDAAIRTILDLGAGHSWLLAPHGYVQEQEERKYHASMTPTDQFDALEFWGKVSGSMLREWGMDEEEVPDEAKEYDVNVWMVGNYVVKAVLNYDPLGEKPYAKTSYIKSPGSFWGRGIPEVIEDIQNVCNAAVRALVNNMAVASGPQVEVNVERIPANEDITKVYPWKIWQTLNDPLGSTAPAVRFHQPNDNAHTLIAVYDRFSQLADDHSGIPAYIYGNTDVQGAGRTASGLSMLMSSAGKGIRQVVMHIDNDVVKPVVSRQFIYNMRYDPDEAIKGDAQIIPRGAANLAVRETTNVRRVEFLQSTANDYDMQILGPNGRAAILREVAKGLQMPVDEIVPTREKAALINRLQAQQAASQPAPVDPAGNPAGGQENNTVRSRVSGK